MAGTTGICWVRNDLRLHDNDPLVTALAEHERVVVVYFIDRRQLRTLEAPAIRKTGPYRVAFLLEALADLRAQLRSIGGELIIRQEQPAVGLAQLVAATGATAVYAQAEVTREELDDEAAVTGALPPTCSLHLHWGKTLYHQEDLPFDPAAIPEPFREFRRPLEKEASVRDALPPPLAMRSVANLAAGALPTAEQLGYSAVTPAFPGGETAGLARLQHYLYDTHQVQDYRRTRNLSLGPDYSSKFSAYLALGCLSPRRVYAEVTEYGRTHKNYGGKSLLFEMRWRDYFIFLARKYGDAIFLPGGFRRRQHDWSQDVALFERWCAGETGIPFVDAHLRELDETGFMSNRGRVNCASFLTHDYRIDWRWGAAWFENRLIDYEVCANWLNWHTQALEIYYTSAPWQGLKYDRDGRYVKSWLLELEQLPAPLIHAPWKMEQEGLLPDTFDLERDYYRPVTENSKWDWAWERIKRGDASSPRRGRKKKG